MAGRAAGGAVVQRHERDAGDGGLRAVDHGQNSTVYNHLGAVTMRGNWTDPEHRLSSDARVAGWVRIDSDLDAGDFVLDALGSRWFQDLGPDNYALGRAIST